MSATGCLSRFPTRPAIIAEPTFDPTHFFGGRTEGQGTLTQRTGSDRALRVKSMGVLETGGNFRLDQTITFGNGTVEQRTWNLRRVDAQHFTATLSDATGPVTAESNGSLFHLRYRLRRAVYMEQWLYVRPNGRALDNYAQITVLGIPWARLSETISRADSVP